MWIMTPISANGWGTSATSTSSRRASLEQDAVRAAEQEETRKQASHSNKNVAARA
jgi:hypothetical protein